MKKRMFLLESELLGPAVGVSLLGLASAVIVCALAIRRETELAMVFLMVSGICDLFDGYLARRTTRSERAARYGRAIDGIVDMPSFGLAPVVLVLGSGVGWYFVPVAVVFVLCAGLRLAYFDIHGTARVEGGEYYLGVPVTYAALVLPLAYLPVPLLEPVARGAWLSATMLLLAALFVLRRRIPKPGGRWYVVFAILAVLLSSYWIVQRVVR